MAPSRGILTELVLDRSGKIGSGRPYAKFGIDLPKGNGDGTWRPPAP
jgi:hypothetical protein